MSAEPPARLDMLTIVVLLMMPLMFSTNLVIGRAATQSVEPATLSFWRWLIAALIMLVICGRETWYHRQHIMAAMPHLVVLGFLGITICGTIIYISLQHTTATNATLIYTTSPIFIVLFERLFRGRLIGAREAVGIALSFIGVVVIVTRGEVDSLLFFQFNQGDLGVLVAAIAWAIYSLILRSPKVSAMPTKVSFAMVALLGTLIVLPSYAYEGSRSGFIPVGREAWFSIFGVAILASVLAFSFYQFGVKRAGPAIASVFMYLLPVYGVGLSVLFLGETLAQYHLVGMVTVLTGIVLATLPKDFRLFRYS